MPLVSFSRISTLEKLEANVSIFERNVAASATKVDILHKNLQLMVANYHPAQIVADLKQMHNLIAGNTPFGKPLFEQLAEEGISLEGKKLDDFIPILLQFQVVVALEVRAVRMLRSFIALEEQDTVFANNMQAIFKDLADQRSKYDPVAIFEWYLNFKAFGCLLRNGGQRGMFTCKALG